MMPYMRNVHLKGRKELLEQLKRKLCEVKEGEWPHRVALHGLGGIGKTQVAIEYVYLNQSTYDRVYWISAVSRDSILSRYRSIANVVNLPIRESDTLDEVAWSLLNWFRKTPSWLVVFDNLDIIESVNGLLPQNGLHQHTLITTRNPRTRGIPAQGFDIPLLDPESAADLLSTLSGIPLESDIIRDRAKTIVHTLGYLPLAIEQAAAFIEDVTGELDSFLDEYRKNQAEVHNWTPGGNRQYPWSVATTWLMSFRNVEDSHPQAAQFLRLFALLNPDGISLDFLNAGREVLDEVMRVVLSSSVKISKPLIILEKNSLIKWNRVTKMVSIHRLIQAVIKDYMSVDELSDYQSAVINLIQAAFPVDWATRESRTTCRLYEQQSLEPLLGFKGVRTDTYINTLVWIGRFTSDEGRYNDCMRVRAVIVDIRTQVLGEQHPETLTAMGDLASTYRNQGKYSVAAELQESVLAARKKVLGEQHPETLTAMSDLAWMYRNQGKYSLAAELQESVLAARKEVLGERHPDTLTAMNSLALTYWNQGKYDATAEKQDTLTTINNVGLTRRNPRKFDAAAELQVLVLVGRKEVLGEQHADTLTAMNDLAVTYRDQLKFDAAAELQVLVLAASKEALGERHPRTLSAMSNLASTYRIQGKYDAAAELQLLALEDRKKVLGERHPHTLTTMSNLSLTYRDQGKYDAAAELQESVLAVRKEVLGERHPHTLATMNYLAVTYECQGKYDAAAKLRDEMVGKPEESVR